MAGRLLFEVFVFSLPFLVFGIYTLATRSAEEAGKLIELLHTEAKVI